MDKYTVFIAQSGSGKSYFLCRLVEKIMLKSKARCLILDPDGDFRKLSSIDRQVWGSNQHIYDTKTARENSPTGVKMDLLKNGCASSKISSLRLIKFRKNLEMRN